MEKLSEYLKVLGRVVIAFSGGVDSTFLLAMAIRSLGTENVIAVTANSLSFPLRELNATRKFTLENNVAHIIVKINELEIDGFSDNPLNRCYLCKDEIFDKIGEVAKKNGFKNIIEGTNADDVSDYRPGFQAIKERGVLSPLKDCELTKEKIREFSRILSLATAEKQPLACLMTRFVYGEKITPQKLEMLDKAEQYLINLNFTPVRVRIHSTKDEENFVARVETSQELFIDIIKRAPEIQEEFKRIGFAWVSLDLGGYRTGSMNV